ncbi:MAG: histidine phosphatase family protein [Burkholderiaceae bacterium]|nr:histidine phosphatase family protein [Burkholderiaceae bacterium]
MTELIVIRHGETDWNRAHRFQGQIDVPLNAMGLQQAQRLGQRLHDEAIDVLVSSDLQRAHTTALAIATAQRGRAPELAPLPEPLWREQAFGVLEGLDVPTIRARHPELWERWIRHEADYALPGGGESNLHFHARVMAALHAVVAAHAGARIVVVAHGGVLDMLWREVTGQPLSGPRTCAIPNTGINRLRWTGQRLDILRWAEAEHLAGLPEQPSTAQTSDPLRTSP